MSEIEEAVDHDAPPEPTPRELPDNELVASVLAGFEDATFERRGMASSDSTYHAVSVPPADWVPFAAAAREHGFDTFIDLAAVDHFTHAPRFEVVLNLLSIKDGERLLVSTRVPYDAPSLPTLTGVFAGANFYEREAFDMFGVTFDGHPDLTRILMPDDWQGHPLRKDFNVGAIPVEFKAGSRDL